VYGLGPVSGGVPLPAGIELLLPRPGDLPGLAPAGVRGLGTAGDLLSLVLRSPSRRAEALRRMAPAGYIGGAARDYLPDGSVPGALAVRAWAVRLRSADTASYALRVVSWALRVGGRGRVSDLDGPADGRLVEATGAPRGTATTALVAAGPWLLGMTEAVPLQGAQGLAAAASALAAAQPPPVAQPGVATGLPVTASLRAALSAARAQALQRGVRQPVPGTVQAATLGSVSWAVAGFPDAMGSLEVFRFDRGQWRDAGDAGGPGCPRLPAAVRATLGLGPSCPGSASAVTQPGDPDALGPSASPFSGIGMWIWYVSRAGGVDSIVARAKAHGIRTVFIKAADGVRPWGQWARAVGPLRAAGLQVCAWQYVYPKRPQAEAALAGAAVRRGSDCFVVDAETEFEHHGLEGPTYRAARTYMRALRRLVGRNYPIGLTSFPYADIHRTFPYSAFLEGPDGADVTLPQIYWGAFRVSVTEATDRTYLWNALYGVPIVPVAGTFRRERPADILRFRCLAAAYGASGASYWSWQDTRPSQWPVLGGDTACAGVAPRPLPYPALRGGMRSDAVVWLQARLRAWGYPVARDGDFGAETRSGLAAFQADQGLPATGRTDPPTWRLLLAPPARTGLGALARN
jgi:hypothetical protein